MREIVKEIAICRMEKANQKSYSAYILCFMCMISQPSPHKKAMVFSNTFQNVAFSLILNGVVSKKFSGLFGVGFLFAPPIFQLWLRNGKGANGEIYRFEPLS